MPSQPSNASASNAQGPEPTYGPWARLVMQWVAPWPRPAAYALAVVLAAGEAVISQRQPAFAENATGLLIGWPLMMLMLFGGGGPVIVNGLLVIPALAYWAFEPRGSFAIADPADLARIVLVALAFTFGALISRVLHGVSLAALLRQRGQVESQRRFQLLFDHSNDGILVCDASHCFVMVNPSACQMLGYSADELLRMRQEDVLSQDIEPEPLRPRRHADGAPVLAGERWLRRKDGSGFLAEVSVKDIGDGLRQAIVRDVSARHETLAQLAAAEERLRQSDKMEALGRLAGGVAHDFNNLLTVIRGYGELMRASPPGAPLDRASLEEMLAAADRGRSLTKQLLAFSRSQPVQPRRVEADPLLLTMQGMLARLLPANVRLVVEAGAADSAIWIEAPQLEQVIMNLVLNARDAMPEGGVIRVKSRAVPEPGGPSGEYELVVSDEGHGIPAEVLPHIFEPFFTTKESGKGTGLGLATVYGIVQQQGGHIEVSSQPGSGSTFRLRFPVIEREAGLPESVVVPELDAPREVAGAEVLLVEDEASLRTLGERVLGRAGFQVRTASDVTGAWSLLHNDGYRPRVAVLDLELPGLSGLHLARRLHETMPDVRILIVSGMLASYGLDELSVRPEWRILPKPYLPEALVQAVSDLAGSQAARS